MGITTVCFYNYTAKWAYTNGKPIPNFLTKLLHEYTNNQNLSHPF